jgi:hypothetical protein
VKVKIYFFITIEDNARWIIPSRWWVDRCDPFAWHYHAISWEMTSRL